MRGAEDFFHSFAGEQRQVMQYLHELLTVELCLEAKIRYKISFYYGRTWICYLNPRKNGGTELAFIRGNELSNHQGMLEVIHEAILLDETTAYRPKRNSKEGD